MNKKPKAPKAYQRRKPGSSIRIENRNISQEPSYKIKTPPPKPPKK